MQPALESLRHNNKAKQKHRVSADPDEAVRSKIQEILAGNTRAFEALVADYQNTVARFVYKVVTHPEDREEVCQDVFVKVYLNLDKFRFDARFTTWLYQIAYRTAVSSLRRKRHETETYDDDIAVSETDVVSAQQTHAILDAAMKKLKLEERSVVTLHYFQDSSIEDISAIIDRPAGTVKSILHRARQKLSTHLERQAPELKEAVGYE